MIEYVKASLEEAQIGLDRLINDPATLNQIGKAGDLLASSLANGGRIFSCGNGGSMCDAMHFAEELTGRYRKNRQAFAAVAINDPSHLTCVANDYGYEYVFSRYLEGHAKGGDCLIAISTSGGSKTILRAAEVARTLGVMVVGLHGRRGSPIESCVDVNICTPAGQFADRVQELHIKVLHILIELIERKLSPENYL